ncbi:MAG: hypothetical protein LBS35_03260 [Synergistaceae bacterium]|jgi:hypothetical protein|nr:hypothetical protein [Synergistaceae bacterium]
MKSFEVKKLISKVCFYIRKKGLFHTLKKIISRIRLRMRLPSYEYYRNLVPEKYESALKHWYFIHTGERLNLDSPRTFNEKIQWLKLHDSTPLKTRLADKYLARDWIKEKIGEEYLIPLLGVWDKFDDIDFNTLPDRFVLKANHGSGWNIVVRGKSKLDIPEARAKFEHWLKTNYAFMAGFELHYKDIKPKIIAEEYIENLDVHGLYDYRFLCFNGEPKSIWWDVGSGTPDHQRDIYDLEWNLQPLRVTWPHVSAKLGKPSKLAEMIDLAKKLSEDFIFVRVDFYYADSKIYMGELTFTPLTGLCNWNPDSYNLVYGEMIHLPLHVHSVI